jgi:outer membrane beta-barrel protein
MLFRYVLALGAALTFFSATTQSLAAPDDSAIDTERDEYDFSWLDPEKKIYVVQNRKYTKAQRFELATGLGVGMGESYRTQRQWNYRGTFFFSEHWGVSVFGFSNFNSENDDYATLKAGNSTVPIVRDTHNYMGGSLMWLPFYGKINMFNQIFYIDWHFELGAGSAATEIDLNRSSSGSPAIESSSHGAFHWGSGWKFFINRHWGMRLDFLATYYSAPNGITSPSATIGSVSGSTDQSYDNYYLTLGLSYTL